MMAVDDDFVHPSLFVFRKQRNHDIKRKEECKQHLDRQTLRKSLYNQFRAIKT